MATTVTLDWADELTSGYDDELVLRYTVRGTTDIFEARDALERGSFPQYDGKFARKWQVKRTGEKEHEGMVTYLPKEQPNWNFQFDAGTEQTKMLQSRETIARYARPGFTAPNHRGAINVTNDGVEGIDIVVPTFSWSETHYYDREAIDISYFKILKGSVGRVVDGDFRGFPRGEVLFLGASGGLQSNQPKWEITYKWMQSDNARNLPVGQMRIASKLGHEAFWVQYVKIEDTAAKAVAEIPHAAYVERVYDFFNVSVLGLNG